MSDLTRRTVTLSKIQSDYIDAKIATGEFVSASEVVRAGLAALTQRDAMVTQWLEREVGPTFDRSISNPDDYVELDAAFAAIRGDKPTRAVAA
jgi:antitoxin ParD1/3/4